jgi:hypothetical protein
MVFGKNECMNGATCQLVQQQDSSSKGTAQCICASGFTGEFCEQLISVRTEQQPNDQSVGQTGDICLNGGTLKLVNAEGTMGYCECREHYSGMKCEEFTFDPCENRAYGELAPHQDQPTLFYFCLETTQQDTDQDNQEDGYLSPPKREYIMHRCPAGLVFNRFLSRCDYDDIDGKQSFQNELNEMRPSTNSDDDKCSPHNILCQNGGLCEVVDNEARCMCPVGYSGRTCQFNTDDCRVGDEADGEPRCRGPSQDDNGRCVDLINGYVCICPNNYYGLDCHTNSNLK